MNARACPSNDTSSPDAGGGGAPKGSAGEVFRAFLVLGLTSFGGPVAHLGYFRQAFVEKRRWIDEAAYADLVALCQFLPGPASSQVGFCLGILRAGGLLGGIAAWVAFTLPSAALLVALAFGAEAMRGSIGDGIVHGLKLAAVAVVAEAVWGMARSLAPDRPRAGIALGALALAGPAAGALGQVGAIALGAAAGLLLCRDSTCEDGPALAVPISRRAGVVALCAFAAILVAAPLAASLPWQGFALFDGFSRAGALVFGGGHVALPLLRAEIVDPGWITPDAFLTGYGAAQAMPGPLFTVAAYYGAVAGGAPGAGVALLAMFLPGLLLVYAALPFWGALRARPAARAAMRGANAAVVGILAAALYDPVFTGAIQGHRDLALAALAFALLTVWRAPPWLVVALTALGGAASAAL